MSVPTNIKPQDVGATLTRSATFLIVSVQNSSEAAKTAKSVLASVDDLSKNIVMRDLNASFSCTIGIGSTAWDRLIGQPTPLELHPFPEIKGASHTAVSTPGDILFHIRADRRDLCFEFERQLMQMLGDSVKVVDSTVGFRYFDNRDLLGFVDGTANPAGQDIPPAVMVSSEDEGFACGSYVVVQKYLHELKAWHGIPIEQQQDIVGRTKLDNIELDDAESGQCSHKTLATVERDGVEYDILRDNMPFGSPSSNEFGTYFIGYSRRLWVIEEMLKRMFIGDPPGLYDKILDYSRPIIGSTFFAPSTTFLTSLSE